MSPERQEHFFSSISWLLIALMLLLLGLAVSFFRGNETVVQTSPSSTIKPTPRANREYVVFYKAGVFGPTNIRIHVGDSVRFQNLDSIPLRILSAGGPRKPELAGFDSRVDIPPNGEYAYTFLKIGIFGYFNLNNPDENGSVTVRP